jgi:CSLREA domain-containing protein
LILTIGSLLTKPVSVKAAATFTVNSTIDSVDASPGDGVCADSLNRCTLRAAVMEANALAGADTIIVPAGAYTLTLGTYDDEFNFAGAEEGTGDLDILNGDLTISGAGSGSTIIDGNGIDRILDINNYSAFGPAVNVTLSGLTLRGGIAPLSADGYQEPGGAIQFDGTDNNTGLPSGTLTINNCQITNNTASGLGGGVLSIFGSLTVGGSEISGNTSQNASGGGILFDGGSSGGTRTLQITNSLFSGNKALNGTFGNGGGLWAGKNANFTITNNKFNNNQAGGNGGGIYADGNLESINQNSLEGNSAKIGGGIYHNSGGALTFNYNVVVNNTATSDAQTSGLRNFGAANIDNTWWGCNAGPDFSPCDRAKGVIPGFNWLTLSHTATPSTIATGGTSTLQADFFTNSMGASIPASSLSALDGRTVTFNNAVLGTVSPTSALIAGGKANATFTSNGNSGTGSADATVDHETVTATINIQAPPSVTTNPTDQTTCNGSSVSFTAASSGFPSPTVQWQVSTDGGANFNDIPGATSTTLTFTATAAQNGNKYRAVFTNSQGTATTSAATLTVNTAPVVTTNPVDQTACEGASVSFTASASGDPAPTVQWQVSTNGGGSYSNISGATSTTLTFTAAASQNGNKYRAVFTNTCGSATTSAATLSVNSNTTATTPADVTVCQGAPASFNTTASGAGPFHYAWTLDGSSFGGDTSSITVPTGALTVGSHPVTVTVTGTCGSVTKSASLTVQANTTATAPNDQTVCQGATATFSTTATGTGTLHYAWKVDGSAFGGDTASISVPTGSLTVGSHSVSVTVSGTCNSVTKNATLTVQANTSATALSNQTVCQGATANFSTTATGAGTLTYQWKLDGNNIPGANSSSVAINTTTLSAGNHNVEVVVGGACGTVNRSATLTVNTAPVVTTNPASQTVTSGNVTFTAAASGSPAPTVQWQVSTNGGASFSNIPGATSTSLTFMTNSSQNGNKYRAVFTNTCGSATTSAATLTTCTPPVVTTNPTSVADACVGQVITFTAAASGTPAPTVQWQVSTNGGASFTNISGATSNTLSVTASVAVRNNQYRAVFTNACGTNVPSSAATLGVDTIAPVITFNHTTYSLWPPNHKYETYNVSDFVSGATDNCNANLLSSVVIASVTSDELDDNPNGGDGNTTNDIVIAANCKSVQLRAERDGDLNGRVYTITFRVTDAAGNVRNATATVTVPHDQSGSLAVNDGPHNTVNGTCP